MVRKSTAGIQQRSKCNSCDSGSESIGRVGGIRVEQWSVFCAGANGRAAESSEETDRIADVNGWSGYRQLVNDILIRNGTKEPVKVAKLF